MDRWISPLSHREEEVGFLTAYGFSVEEISKKLFISSETVKHHRASIKKKLQCRSSFETGARTILYLKSI